MGGKSGLKARKLWHGCLALAAALLLGKAGAAQAASSYYVVKIGGSDANPCTLAQPCSSVARGMQVAADGDTILISEGIFEENLAINKRLMLRGAGMGKTIIDGNGLDRVVEIDVSSGAGNTVALEDMTIRKGKVNDDGGGIRVNAGSLALRRVEVLDNQANGHLGGGIFCAGGTAAIFDSTIKANQAFGGGGVAVGANCQLTLDSSTVYLNNASYAAGVLVMEDGAANLTNATVSFNVASGGLPPGQLRTGGLDVEEGGSASLNHCTLAHNFAVDETYDGWQLWAKGTLTVSNTILYGIQGPDCKVYSGATFSSSGYNLSGDASCALNAPGDLPNSDPLLGGLTDNGGPSFTHALPAGSPAVDAAGPPDPATPTHDQRGLAHRDGDFDGTVRGDIGAFEYQPRAVWLALVVR